MQISGIRRNDIVQVDKKGRRFLATVNEKEPGLLHIRPLPGEKVSYFTASAHEVIGHWKRMFPK